MDAYHATLRFAMRTGGRLSDGIRLGYEKGFNAGVTVDYVYRNRPHGITPVGTFIDRVMLNHPVWRGVRGRRRLLVRQVCAALAESPGQTLFDVAAGPGSYLFALPRDGAAYWAGDRDPDEVERGRGRAAREERADIHFVVSDAFDPATWPEPSVDVLVASGFFDILDRSEDVRRLLAAGTAGTHVGSRWVLTVMEDHPDLALLRDVLVDWDLGPWVAVTRTAEEVIEEARPFGWEPVVVEREKERLFGVATLRRVR